MNRQESSVAVCTAFTLLTVCLAVIAGTQSPVETTTIDETLVVGSSESNGQRHQDMLVWAAARANPGGRRLPLSPPSSMQLVSVDVRRIQRKVDNVSTSESAGHENNSATANDDMSLADQLHLARIRRKNFRLLTILKNINDRIGRGASPPPPSVIEPGRGVGSLPVWNTTSSAGCGTQNSRRRLQHDDCDDGDDGLTQSETTKVTADDVHVIARSCVRRQLAPTTHRRDGDVSVQDVDDASSGSANLWLEFDRLRATWYCRSGKRDDRTSRSRLVIYLRGNYSTGNREPSTSRRTRRRQLKRTLTTAKLGLALSTGTSGHHDRRQRGRHVLLLSVYQEVSVRRRRQRNSMEHEKATWMHSSQYKNVVVGRRIPEDHREERIPLDENAVRAQEVDSNVRQEIRSDGKRPREAYSEMMNPTPW